MTDDRLRDSGEQNLGRRAASGAAWVLFERVGLQILSLAVFAVLGRLLAPEEFGLAALATTALAFISVFVTAGFSQVLVQRSSIDPRLINTAFWTSLVVALALSGALAVSSGFIAASYDQPELQPILIVLGLSLPVTAISSVPAALLERDLDFRSLALRQFAANICGALAALSLAVAGFGVWALVMQSVVSTIVGTTVLLLRSQWRPQLQFSFGELRRMLGFGSSTLGMELLLVVQSNIDKLLIGIFLGTEPLGYYFMAQKIVVMVTQLVTTALSRISLPALSRLQQDPQRLARNFLRLNFVGMILCVPAFALVAGFAAQIVPAFFGPDWEPAIELVQWMALATAVGSIGYFDKSALLALGKPGIAFGLVAGQVLLGTVLVASFVNSGIVAVAIAGLVRPIAYFPVRMIVLARPGGIDVTQLLSQVAKVFVAGVTMLAGAAVLQRTGWSEVQMPIVAFVLPASMLLVCAYAGVLQLVARRELSDAIQSANSSFNLRNRRARATPRRRS